MINRKVRNQLVDVGLAERVRSSAGGKGIQGAIRIDVGRIIRGACRSFARAADWQHSSHVVSHHGDSGLDEIGTGYRLSEDHEGLHSGSYISVSILPAANALAIRGGYYDSYRQPKTIHQESIPLREITAQSLGSLLMEMHDRLGRCARAKST
jgi:hypothetical protein